MKPFSRRDFVQTAGLSTAALVLSRCGFPNTHREELPNIVYILADDMGYGDVTYFNSESNIPTPHMDRLASEGIHFTDAHSGSAVCSPTRYGILTGRYCWRSRLKSGVLWGYSPALIPPDRQTVASLLKQAGYRTGCVGKWHLGLNWATSDGYAFSDRSDETGEHVDYSQSVTGGPTELGFDWSFVIPASLDMVPYVYVENDRVVEPPTEITDGDSDYRFFRSGPIAPSFEVEEVLPTLTQKAVGFIDEHAQQAFGEPFFLYFPLTAPHTPILPTEPFQGESGIGPYGDFVHQCDWTVGQVLEALERNGKTGNTLLIVTSDNGCSPMADFQHLESLAHDPSFGFRGHKADIFEGGHRIPFIARWPDRIAAGTACNDTICLTDLMATAASIVGADLPENAGEDSVSILPDLLGVAESPVREATVHHSVNGSFSIRMGRWKLELCPGSGGWSDPVPQKARELGLPPIQLYDLHADISERVNVQEQHPEVVQRLTQLLVEYVENGRSTPGQPQANEGEVSIWRT